MVKNFLIVAIRNLRRNSLYSIINIAGLSIGIVCGVLILLWVEDETSSDKFIPKADRLHQVWVNAEFDGSITSWRSVPLPLYEALKTANSNIKTTAVAGWGFDRLLTVDETRLIQDGYYVSDEFLEMFEFPLIAGDASKVLDELNSIVITESLAKKLFGDKDPLNQTILVSDESSMQVTGILKDLPGNSSFQFEYLMPWKHRVSVNPWVVRNQTNWGNYSFQVYVELFDESKELDVEEGIRDLLTENGESDMPRELFLYPMPRWRLHSNFENGIETGGMNDYVQLFTLIAAFILIIACINFMNLATARSEKRAREVGIRKSVGSSRSQLILQFMGESIFIVFIAFLIAILLSQLVMPAYNSLVEKELFIDFTTSKFWIFSLSLILITGIISGSYPAFYLSSFKPVKTLKGTLGVGKSGSTPRKILIVIQFGFAILLMIGTTVIFKQIEMVKGRHLGYDQENLISIDYTDDLEKNYTPLKLELLQSGAVEAVTRSNSTITQINSNNFVGWPGKPEDLKVIFTTIATEYDYTKTMGIKILEGRDFSEEFTTDTTAIIINEAALDIMGLEDPIGTQLDLWGEKRNLIGIVDNVLMGSPYRVVKPMFLFIDPDWIGAITVRLVKTNDLQATLGTVESIFEKYNPAYPFDYTFTDVEFERKFSTIKMTQKLASLFSLLAIFITGLGLFGLASFTAEQRIKEIGIRKVLGASISSLITLMSKDFSKLVIVAFVISAPITWYLMNQYLERYPIRVNIEWWIFPFTGIIALIFALTIVAHLARRAALANPVNSLRNE